MKTLKVPDLDVMQRFLLDFGMQTARRDADVLYMRGSGEIPYVHVTHQGPAQFLGVAFDASSGARPLQMPTPPRRIQHESCTQTAQ